MNQQPQVSVLTACLNSEAGLLTTLHSVAEQSYGSLQHVVVDGGSTDGSVGLLEGSRRVVWISEPDRGIGDALNKGLAMATGEWILVLQADDYLVSPSSLSDAVALLSDDVDVLSFDVAVPVGSGWRRYRSRGFSIRTLFKTTIPHQGALVRRTLIDAIGGFDDSLDVAMDYDLFLAAWHRGARVKTVSEVLAVMPSTGLSARSDWRSLWSRFAEERRIHFRHATPRQRLVYLVYWPGYLTYRAVRFAVAAAWRGAGRLIRESRSSSPP